MNAVAMDIRAAREAAYAAPLETLHPAQPALLDRKSTRLNSSH